MWYLWQGDMAAALSVRVTLSQLFDIRIVMNEYQDRLHFTLSIGSLPMHAENESQWLKRQQEAEGMSTDDFVEMLTSSLACFALLVRSRRLPTYLFTFLCTNTYCDTTKSS